jgi:hypothetical protein
LCKLIHYQWFVLQFCWLEKSDFFIKRMRQISQNLRIFLGVRSDISIMDLLENKNLRI